MNNKVPFVIVILLITIFLSVIAYTLKNYWTLKNEEVVITSAKAYVRKGPDTKFDRVATLFELDRIKSLGIKFSPQKNPWIKIEIPASKIQGYVSAKLLRINDKDFLFQFATINNPNTKLIFDLKNESKYKTLKLGEEVKIFSSKNDDKDLLWFYIKAGDVYGYVPLGDLKLSVRALSLNIIYLFCAAIIICVVIVTILFVLKKNKLAHILCQKCGLSIPVDSKFCPGCGIMVNKSLHSNSVDKTVNDLSEDFDTFTGEKPKMQPSSGESVNQSSFAEKDIGHAWIGTPEGTIIKPFSEEKAFVKNNDNQELDLASEKEQKTEKYNLTTNTRGYKKAFAVSIIISLFCALSYLGWNEFTIYQLQKELEAINTAQSTSADREHLTLFYGRLVSLSRRATKNNLPLYTQRYKSIVHKCILMLQRSPSFTAAWVKKNRKKALLPVGSINHPKDSISDSNLVDAVRNLKSICETGIAAQDGIVKSAEDLGIPTASIKGMHELAGEVKIAAIHASELAHVGQRVAKIKGKARARVQQGLRKIDQANRDIEKYANLDTLGEVCDDWQSAQDTITSAREVLSSLPLFEKAYQRKIAEALVKSDREKIDSILSKIKPHLYKARNELAKARSQERTVAGRTQRTVGRFLEKTKKKFSGSRIGREITLSFKTMILGTKIFYDMMDMDSNSDMMGWAMNYQKDMNQLLDEVEEVNKMDGWSLTGKNTFIEDFANRKYEESFNKD